MVDFKVGDMVEYIGRGGYNSARRLGHKGKILEIGGIEGTSLYVQWNDGTKGSIDGIKFILRTSFRLIKSGKQMKEYLIRFMAYGMGCNNLGSMLMSEKELRAELKRRVTDSNWTGRIIGYKLTPILEAETKVVLSTFKRTKVRKYKKGGRK